MDLGPTVFPRPFIQDNHISKPMTYMLATIRYVCLFSDWAQQFDKLKRALTCAELTWWMYSLWFQLFASFCFHLLERLSLLYDKQLRALMGFDLNNNL